MSISQRIAIFFMSHVGFFALVFLLASVQPPVNDVDPATERLAQAAAEGNVVMAGDVN